MKTARPIRLDRWRSERRFWDSGMVFVAGVDEAGRGPLAGPVVAVAAILDEEFAVEGVGDSKGLTPERRLELFPAISTAAKAWGVGLAGPAEIDQVNILNATWLAMQRALEQLTVAPQAVLVDGNHNIPDIVWPQQAIIGGDRTSISIGAASILAKEIRDRIMEEFDADYPEYGFVRHKGYATPEHTEALRRLGPCPIHRHSFAPVRDWRQRSLAF